MGQYEPLPSATVLCSATVAPTKVTQSPSGSRAFTGLFRGVRVQVHPPVDADRVLADEARKLRIVVPRAHEVQTGARIQGRAREAEGVVHRFARSRGCLTRPQPLQKWREPRS